jgi:hypothetical protein
MRLITDDVLDLIAGGDYVVTVHGTRETYDPPPYFPPYDPWDPYGGGGGYGDTGGGGGGDNPTPPCQVHNSAPPPVAPAGVDLNTLRNMVEAASNEIAGMPRDVEHAFFFLRMPDGHVERAPVIHGTPNGFDATVELNGGRVVAYIHSHPAESGVDETIPSYPGAAAPGRTPDTTFALSMITSGAADPGALMYIRDNASGHTFEYTIAGPNAQRTQGADISSDHPPC